MGALVVGNSRLEFMGLFCVSEGAGAGWFRASNRVWGSCYTQNLQGSVLLLGIAVPVPFRI